MDILDIKFRCVKLAQSMTYAECVCEQRAMNPVCQKCITGNENIKRAEKGLKMGRRPGRQRRVIVDPTKEPDKDQDIIEQLTNETKEIVTDMSETERKKPSNELARKVHFTPRPDLIKKVESLAKKNIRTFSEQVLWMISLYEE